MMNIWFKLRMIKEDEKECRCSFYGCQRTDNAEGKLKLKINGEK